MTTESIVATATVAQDPAHRLDGATCPELWPLALNLDFNGRVVVCSELFPKDVRTCADRTADRGIWHFVYGNYSSACRSLGLRFGPSLWPQDRSSR